MITAVYYVSGERLTGAKTEHKRMKTKKILVVEDEKDIADLLALHLRDLADDVVLAADGHEGMRLACAKKWDLIILDLRLPGPDGLEICRAVRRKDTYTSILMLTSKSSELDRVLGISKTLLNASSNLFTSTKSSLTFQGVSNRGRNRDLSAAMRVSSIPIRMPTPTPIKDRIRQLALFG